LDKRLAAGFAARLRAERAQADATRQRLDACSARMRQSLRVCLERRGREVANVLKLLASYDPKNVLARGFALVRRAEDDALLRTAAAVAPGEVLSLEFADGKRAAVAAGDAPAPRPRAEKPRRGAPATQGSLF
ncbi:MAG TPA: exodeoxyribonuclease VII large subunit, partial [Beijerinckiaceae bacterium]